jgi:hypothetical protein
VLLKQGPKNENASPGARRNTEQNDCTRAYSGYQIKFEMGMRVNGHLNEVPFTERSLTTRARPELGRNRRSLGL